MKKNTIKRIVTIALALILLMGATMITSIAGIRLSALNFTSLNASAAEDNRTTTINDITYTYNLNGKTGLKLISVAGNFPENYVIPSEIDGYEVKELGDAFKGTGVVNVTVPEGITRIGIRAFNQCSSLNTVYFNAEKCICDVYAHYPPSHPFMDSSLKTIVFGDKITVIPESICANAAQLKEVIFNGEVTKISDYAFYSCTSLEGIDDKYISELTEIGKKTFAYSKYKSFICPERLYSIDEEAFRETPLSNLNLRNVKTIGNHAFRSTKIAELTIPKTVDTIGYYAFSEISTLKKVTVNSNKINVKRYAGNTYGTPFSDDGMLTDVCFGENVTTIPSRILASAKYVETVEFKAAINSVGEAAFYGCDCLEDIYCPAMTENYWNNGVKSNIAKDNDILSSENVTYHWKENNAEEPVNPEKPADSENPTAPVVNITRIKIAGTTNEFDYHSTITFKAEVTNDAGKEIVWYVNGQKAGTGSEFTVGRAEDDFTIMCRTQDANGNTVESETLEITVRNDIISIIIAIIRGLFGTLPVVYR